jgi:hypothetical protein
MPKFAAIDLLFSPTTLKICAARFVDSPPDFD